MNCDSLIFDLDGTLWDASEAVSQSWAHTLRNTYQVKNPPSIAEIQSIMGLSAREIADRLFSRYGEDPDEIAQYCMRQECDYLAVHGGAAVRRRGTHAAGPGSALPLEHCKQLSAGIYRKFPAFLSLGAPFYRF